MFQRLKKFIDKDSGNKIVGFYSFDDSLLEKNIQVKFKQFLSKSLKSYDLVVVADYGHGLINDEI